MILLKNYTVEQFYMSPPDEEIYTQVFKYIEPNNQIYHVQFKGFWSSPYEKYLTVKNLITKQPKGWEFDVIDACFGFTPEQQKNISAYTFFATMDYVSKDLLAILEKEKMLVREPNFDLMEAGVDKLNKFGDILTVDSLARTYNTTWEEIGKWTYSKVFSILMLEKERAEIQEKYQKIIERKNKK